MEFYRAGVDDASLLGRLHATCWREAYRDILPNDYLAAFTPEKRTAFFQRILPVTENEQYVLYAGGEAAGMLAIGKTQDETLPAGYGEIHALYLLPAFWGKGLGRRAMDFSVKRLRALGFAHVALWVISDNARARRFYDAYGFLPDGAEEPITLGREFMEMRYQMPLLPGQGDFIYE